MLVRLAVLSVPITHHVDGESGCWVGSDHGRGPSTEPLFSIPYVGFRTSSCRLNKSSGKQLKLFHVVPSTDAEPVDRPPANNLLASSIARYRLKMVGGTGRKPAWNLLQARPYHPHLRTRSLLGSPHPYRGIVQAACISARLLMHDPWGTRTSV